MPLAVSSTTRRGTRRQPEASRSAILQAALVEFAQEGIAGARMDAIAAAAGVNKALLYYYFRDKEALYAAVLDDFFVRLLGRVTQAFDGAGPAGERLLNYARAHFDCIAESLHYARLFQGELMSAGRGKPSHLTRVVERYIRPISVRLIAVLQEGITSGEFRRVDAMQFAPSIAGMIVHYFVVAPVARKLLSRDPFSQEALQQRRAAVLDFIAAALFADQSAGVKLAVKVASRAEAQPGVASNAAKTSTRRFRVQGKRK
ncbi:MAG: TetR/AcrR family transcriptional regulator [Candidatus Korobacteraceae bacterium]|jgi:TetR/AcrR family transcriptional regulator